KTRSGVFLAMEHFHLDLRLSAFVNGGDGGFAIGDSTNLAAIVDRGHDRIRRGPFRLLRDIAGRLINGFDDEQQLLLGCGTGQGDIGWQNLQISGGRRYSCPEKDADSNESK